jgi:hypothetical protein
MNSKKDGPRARRGESGQVLAGVIMLVMLLLIIIPAMVQWVQIESKASVKDQKATLAFNLAEAAVERGYWKVKSSTGACNQAIAGTVIPGYNFDTTYTDVSGGTYRIQISSAGSNSFTVVGEGRDNQNNVTRAITAVYKNQTVYSPLMSSGSVAWGKGICPMWGPIMTQGNITLSDDFVANWYFPRKYAQGTVTGTALNPRDLNGLTPPNTDNVEWWSDYQYVPDLPILDFAALKSSATNTGTLNIYGCKGTGAAWDGRASCGNITDAAGHAHHFSASYNYPSLGAKAAPAANSYVWYYDNDLILGGDTIVNIPNGTGTYGIGLHGTLIVRGNLTLDANGDYNYSGNVPVNAAAEYTKLTKTTFDTNATNEYPADIGLNKTKSTWNFGTDSSCVPATGSCGWRNTVGVRGFTYVGGNLVVTNNGFMDFNGAVWVNGGISANGANSTTFCGVYFDDQLTLPTLNVVLTRTSWNETLPSATVWQ